MKSLNKLFFLIVTISVALCIQSCTNIYEYRLDHLLLAQFTDEMECSKYISDCRIEIKTKDRIDLISYENQLKNYSCYPDGEPDIYGFTNNWQGDCGNLEIPYDLVNGSIVVYDSNNLKAIEIVVKDEQVVSFKSWEQGNLKCEVQGLLSFAEEEYPPYYIFESGTIKYYSIGDNGIFLREEKTSNFIRGCESYTEEVKRFYTSGIMSYHKNSDFYEDAEYDWYSGKITETFYKEDGTEYSDEELRDMRKLVVKYKGPRIDSDFIETHENILYTYDEATYNGIIQIEDIKSEEDCWDYFYLITENINKYITYVSLPIHITTIPERTFGTWYALESISLPTSLVSIGKSAFSCCISLSSINLPPYLQKIEGYAFEYCLALSSITLPNLLETIESNTFANCSSLSNITIPKSVRFIETEAFSSCDELSSINLDNVKTINLGAFFGCNKLRKTMYEEITALFGDHCFDRPKYRKAPLSIPKIRPYNPTEENM